MIDHRPTELFAERPIRSDFGQPRPRLGRKHVIAVLVVAALLTGTTMYLHFRDTESDVPTEIPTIKAEGPLKERPEQPGGIDIPHQDVLVFQQIENADGSKQHVEHLLPAPETPEIVETPTKETVATTVTPKPVEPAPEINLATTVEAAPPQTEAPVATGVSEKPILAKTAPHPHEAVKAAAPTSLPKELFTSGKVSSTSKATSGTMIQLASVQDKTAAQNELKKMQAKYKAALGNTKLRLAQADLGSKGTYYRVQSEPLTDTKARSLCATLKKQQASCIVVSP